MNINKYKQLKEKYPDRLPVICTIKAAKKKYLVKTTETVGDFLYIIKCKLNISSYSALFILVNGQLCLPTETLGSIYNRHQRDGLLYMTLMEESTFG